MIEENSSAERQGVIKGIDAISEQTGLSLFRVMNWRRLYDFPVTRDGKTATWNLDLKALRAWMKEWDVKSLRTTSDSHLERVAIRSAMDKPGRVIEGDLERLCKALNIGMGTMLFYRKHDGFPMETVSESPPRFRIDINKFQSFEMDNNLRNWALPRSRGWS